MNTVGKVISQQSGPFFCIVETSFSKVVVLLQVI